MKILFDQGTPAPLRHALKGHDVATAVEMNWAGLTNGELLEAAEQGFDALVTTDRNLRFQQNLVGRRLAILVLPTTSWPRKSWRSSSRTRRPADARPIATLSIEAQERHERRERVYRDD